MKKVIIITVSVIVIALSLFLVLNNAHADDKAAFTIENQEIECVESQLYFYNSEKQAYDASADILDVNTKITAADEKSQVKIKFDHKPLRVYELTGTSAQKADFDKESGEYSLHSLREKDCEYCDYIIVADYGIRKNVYSFSVYNKTYIEKRYNINPDNRNTEASAYNSIQASDDIRIELNCKTVQPYYIGFGFSINNDSALKAKAAECLLEKNIGGVWYNVDKNDNNPGKELSIHFPLTVEPESKSEIVLHSGIETVFNTAYYNIDSGVYRFVIPLSDEENKAAVSDSFTVGCVPD